MHMASHHGNTELLDSVGDTSKEFFACIFVTACKHVHHSNRTPSHCRDIIYIHDHRTISCPPGAGIDNLSPDPIGCEQDIIISAYVDDGGIIPEIHNRITVLASHGLKYLHNVCYGFFTGHSLEFTNIGCQLFKIHGNTNSCCPVRYSVYMMMASVGQHKYIPLIP